MAVFTDVDECALAEVTSLQACQSGEECTNTVGSFTCSCPAGYAKAVNGQGCVGTKDAQIHMKIPKLNSKEKYKNIYFALGDERWTF